MSVDAGTWVFFLALVLGMLAVDLLSGRSQGTSTFRGALMWSGLWIALFDLGHAGGPRRNEAVETHTHTPGYKLAERGSFRERQHEFYADDIGKCEYRTGGDRVGVDRREASRLTGELARATY